MARHTVALVGCGRILSQHVEGYRRLGERAEVRALCDVDADLARQRAAEHDVPQWYASVDDLIAGSEADVVSVLTPPAVRLSVVQELAEAGRHLLVEKPFALDIEEARRMVEVAAENRVKLAVNQNWRCREESLRVRELIEAGEIGEPLFAIQNDSVWRDESEGWRVTIPKLALSVMGIHWLDRLRWWLGDEPVAVHCAARTAGVLHSAGEDITATTVEFKQGAVAVLLHSWASQAGGEANFVQVDGTKGSITLRGSAVRLHRRGWDRARQWECPTDFTDTFARSMAKLLDAIDQDTEADSSGRDNLWSIAIMDAAYRSAGEHRRVTIEELIVSG